jgi:catechol 2,3-dioxygenase-like lactoylglutathione lyase family enzyme
LNHTIVSCRDQQRSAAFLTGILGLLAATRFGHFLVVQAGNGVSLDFDALGDFKKDDKAGWDHSRPLLKQGNLRCGHRIRVRPAAFPQRLNALSTPPSIEGPRRSHWRKGCTRGRVTIRSPELIRPA